MSATFLNPNNIWREMCNFPSSSSSPDNLILCVNLDDIFCSTETYSSNKAKRSWKNNESKCLNCNLAVITPYSAGFSKAPYYGQGKATPEAQPLSKMVVDDTGRSMSLYSFMRDKNAKYRGPICPELTGSIMEGSSLRFMVTEHTFEFENEKATTQKKLFPDVDVIPAFSTLLVSVRVRNNLKAQDGEMLKITCIEFANRGLNAFLPVLDRLPTSLDHQNQINDRCRQFSSCQNLFSKNGDFFMCPKASESSVFQVDNDHKVIKVFNWHHSNSGEAIEQVDIPFYVVEKQLNFKCMEKARRLLELVSSLGCLALFVGKNKVYTKNGGSDNVPGLSSFRCIPVIRYHKMFGMEHDQENSLISSIANVCNNREHPFTQVLHNGYQVEYDPTANFLLVNTGKRLAYEREGALVSREICFRFDLLVFVDNTVSDMDVCDGNTDTQIYHKSMKLRKYTRIHVDLGPDGEDGRSKLDYICLVMDINSYNVQSNSTALPMKRKSVEEEDDDSFDD
ncbi:hypothetical protein GUITHDRAFT_121620 [Guillardia theta CCMP2712]|uniref:Uncharacterized protein n=1 Tax=Guillardia theta (strain CCMP2712) TaxID=905079 RepID=L1I7H3_GUITC|nr:hypothetical protein GUITHDRAFT_121620 [Guillardia theta CCMP2712]EKX32198.1 hypothetical protein GUITHDRAFT_121620 [Guillardia theta CCMP2712]|eukprot:XP_005819178.1 hypothetical protein GUITHDRAFT_121620 [Guillardia theta CCMP2712]